MLLAERTRAERLEQIIKEMQRHRFGRRAETLPEDQLLLGLEDVEQTAASEEADHEAEAPAEQETKAAKRRTNRGSLPSHLPRAEMVFRHPSWVFAHRYERYHRDIRGSHMGRRPVVCRPTNGLAVGGGDETAIRPVHRCGRRQSATSASTPPSSDAAKFHRHAHPVAIAQKSVFVESVVINVDHRAIIQSS
jgi:Transposase C of IS166 homeodomain